MLHNDEKYVIFNVFLMYIMLYIKYYRSFKKHFLEITIFKKCTFKGNTIFDIHNRIIKIFKFNDFFYQILKKSIDMF